jgi:hypothetical protein
MDAFSVQGTNLIALSVSVRLNTDWLTTHDMLPESSLFHKVPAPFETYLCRKQNYRLVSGTTHELETFFFQMLRTVANQSQITRK